MAQDAAALKEEGNSKFKVGEYSAAIDAYTRSLELDSSQHLCYSNRSAAYLKLGGKAEEALRDAEKCVELAPEWPKGYNRQAAALQELQRWDEAIAVCEKGLKASNDESLRKMISEVRNRSFLQRLKGKWHGKVSEELGGYEQSMEFLDDSVVRVEVLGRSIDGKFWMDCTPVPHHLSIQIPMPNAPPGMPQAPPVPYIVKIDDAGLHACCPFMKMDRPTEFEGPGYCLMVPGGSSGVEAEAECTLTGHERLIACTKDFMASLPSRKLEEPLPSDPEDVAKDKLMAGVKFESSMFAIQKRFGEDTLKEVLCAARGEGEYSASLVAAPELKELRQKLKVCGLIDEEPANTTPAAPSPAPAPEVVRNVEKKIEIVQSKEPADTGSTPEAADKAGLSPQVVCAVAIGAAAAAAVGVFLWRRQRR
eukprot:TRINITY_DN45767_c0_g1_i1.p1 TRINITY_DN45767_c0_g1~~TRINITY_DN45767_c0_g1_i1.p1  ORF type:complete len:421 (+),score=107.87 TRINITY_DN45767_c0_g1_i1:60-1322(+)